MSWFAALLLVWLLVLAFALLAQQRGSARSVRRWTTRLYAVTLVPLTALVVGSVLVVVELVWVDGITVDGAVRAAMPYAQWMALVVNLVVVDMLLRRTGPAGRPARGGDRGRDRTAYGFTSPSPAKPLPGTVRD